MPTDLRSVLDAFRSDMLADVTRALSESPRRAESGGQASEQGGTSRSHKRRHHSRRRRPSSSSSLWDESSSGSTDGYDAREATTSHAANPSVSPIPVVQFSDDRFSQVLDCTTYRLRNRRTGYGAAQARKMGRTTKNMKHSFGGFPPFSGKDPLKVFSWLRKLVKACNDNDVSEGMALYAIPHFLSGDAELRYTRELPDSGTALGVASITSYPVAVNWFLQTYAEPHTLALAQDTFSRAIIEPDETIESFSARLRGLSDRCGNIHTEGTMKQQLIQGLPAYIRTDAFVYNTPACSFQQLVTYTSGKHKAAEEVMNLARDGQGPSTPSSSRGPRRLSVTPRARPTRADFPVMALGEAEPPVAPPPPAANPGQAQPVWGRQDNLPRFLTGRPEDPRRPRICFLCWTPGHMSYTCPILTDQQKALVNKARESFLQATRSRGAGQDEKGRVTRTYNRQIRIAMVQALCDGIDKSDAEDKQELDPGNQSGNEQDKPGSGNV